MSAAVTSPSRRLAPGVRMSRRGAASGVLVLWLIGHAALRGRDTLPLAQTSTTSLHDQLNRLDGSVSAQRNSSFLFTHGVNHVQIGMTRFVDLVQSLISGPGLGRPAPVFGWLAVLVLGGLLVARTAGLRMVPLFVLGTAFLGWQGLWQESMDTLALTLAAVFIAVVVGVPLGIWAGLDHRVRRVVTPVLDVMQTIPTMVYLAPLVMLFLIGNASATIATLVYAVPPVIRVTALAIRSVSPATVEASRSLGATDWQTLLRVRIPMALRTIVLGINQTIMAALAMVTIAALISAPGLGQVVIDALATLDVGTAFNGGLAIVVLAVVMDRVTTAVGQRAGRVRTRRPSAAMRRLGWGVAAVAGLTATYLSFTYWWANTFPTGGSVGPHIVSVVNGASAWVQDTCAGFTGALRNLVTSGLLNPFQALLTDSPFWLTIAMLTLLALLVGGRWAAFVTLSCLGLVAVTGLWRNAMETLAMTVVATLLTMALAVVVGVAMARRHGIDRALRPLLDAAQVIPAFVYLVPFLALFGATRFTAIVCAMVYAVPVAAKLVADGVRGVPEPTLEAVRSVGATPWQEITQVQIPLAGRSLALATNQGLIYVLAMAVVGGMVGAGGLGYQVYNGFSQDRFFGKGLAAGLAIALLGIFLDRISQAIAGQVDPSANRA